MTDDLPTPTSGPAPTPACARLDAWLMDYLEGDLPPAERAEAEAHLAGCARCAALVADLRAVATEAAALPGLRPTRDLWAGIAERIEAPVVSLGGRGDGHPSAPAVHVRPAARRAEPCGSRATVAVTRRWLAAAAALLVATTAGATWLATRAGQPAAVQVAVQVAATPPAGDAAAPAPERPSAGGLPDVAPTTGPTGAGAAGDPGDGRADAARPAPRPPRPDARLAARGRDEGPDAAVPGAADYDREIGALRAVVRERRTELDSGTVAVLERNLGIIDEAIRQSREALARDPNSSFLGRQLTQALDRKLELLRTVALLPRS